MEPTFDRDHLTHFRTFGFAVLRRAFDPAPLLAEVDRVMSQKFRSPFRANVGGGDLSGRYVPMMCERTPVSLSLLDTFARPAASLLGVPVLPVRAKSVLYFAATAWHRDNPHDVRSVGFAAYLEPLRAGTGALRVLPGSHQSHHGEAVAAYLTARCQEGAEVDPVSWVSTLPGFALETDPGDVIAFDEHLFHASMGGQNRRQWRVDYVADPVGLVEEKRVRAYYAGVYLPDWDGGYDVDSYPSYGSHWMGSGRPWIDRLGQLGAYRASAAEEAFARSQRA